MMISLISLSAQAQTASGINEFIDQWHQDERRAMDEE